MFYAPRGSAKLTDQEALALVNTKVDPSSFETERRSFEEGWIKNLAFFAGKQHFVQEGTRLREPENVPEHRVFYRANFILGSVMRACSKIMQMSGSFAVAPKNGSKLARDAAKLSMKIFEHQKEITSYEYKKMLAYLWAANCGSVYLKPVWDPTAGEPDRFFFDNMKDKTPIGNLSAEEQKQKVEDGEFMDLPSGDVDIGIVSPFSFYWDWKAREGGIEDCGWCAQVQATDIDDLYDLYGSKAEKVRSMDEWTGSIYYEEALSFMTTGVNSLNTAFTTPDEKRGRRVRTVEYWERPNRSNKYKGRHILAAGDQILSNGDNKYRVTGYPLPFVKMDWWPMPGRFPGLSLTEQLVSPQFQYNKARAAITEHQNVHGHPPILSPKGAGIPTGHYTIGSGDVIEYDPLGGMPTVMQIPPLPNEVMQNASLARGEMREIAADASPDVSNLPGGIRGSEGIALMLEEKNIALTPTATASLKVDREVGRMFLSYGKLFYRDQRVMHFAGPNGELKAVHFSNADINNDLRILAEPMQVLSVAGQRSSILDYVQTGVLMNPALLQTDPGAFRREQRAVLKALHYSSPDEALEDQLLDEEMQEREIEMIKADPVAYMPREENPEESGLPINPFDDHQVHIQVLDRALKGTEFAKLDQISQLAIFQHRQAHVMELERAMQMAQMAQEGAGGAQGSAPRQPGIGSPPKQPTR